ncbi:MAG: peptidoglycan-binding protein [Methylobacteriaceae bacterium]|nr:peptidoglycan-binding protein [Methylobacteriaceae bacterium]
MTAIVLQRLRNRPLTTVACAAFAALITGGVVNALFLQTHRHPAPLFRTAPAVAPKAQAAASQAAPTAAPPAPAQPRVAATPPPRPAEAVESRAEPRAAEPKKHDAIAALLRSGAASGESAAPRAVLSAQKALARLGYDIKPDGVMGAATRQAIERFERRNNLPVTGEISPRTLRKLSAASGLAMD